MSNLLRPPEWLARWDEAIVDSPFGLPPNDVATGSVEDRCAGVMGRFCSEAVSAVDGECTVMNYREIGPGTVHALARRFGLTYPEGAPLDHLFRQYSKRPNERFAADDVDKHRLITDKLRRSSARWVVEPYTRLTQVKPLI